MIVLDLILSGLIIVSIAFSLVCTICTLQFSRRLISNLDFTEPASILIPVCGLDSAARENWLSFCQQHYPEYEVLFGVKDANDPAIPVLQEVISLFPDRAKLFFDLPPRGINHQISNLMYLLEASKHDIIILADSDIQVTTDYLKKVTAPLSDLKIGVVTCGYVDHNPQSIGAALASLGRCVDFLPSVLLARFLDKGMKFALGPTIVTRKSVINKIGGLQQVVDRIGSDYNIGKLSTEAGYQVELSDYILNNNCTEDTPWQVFKRELRWARTIRFNRGNEYYGMIVIYGFIYATLFLLVSGFQFYAIALFALFILIRLLQVVIAISCFQCPKLIGWLWLLPVRDLMSFAIWLMGGLGKRVSWRGRWLEIGTRGALTEAEPDKYRG
jgi:ceramide glucosyltransferase